MLYFRHIFTRLRQELETKEIVVLTGMRRVGKTTALSYLYDLVGTKNKLFLDLENPIHRKLFEEEDYGRIWDNLKAFNITNKTKAYLFLDEVQNLPGISSAVKYLYDHWKVKFILTGSSSYYLKNLFPESLAGRKLLFEIFPLTFSEFLVFKNIDWREEISSFAQKAANKDSLAYKKLINLYKEYMYYGGFPSVVLEDGIERKKMMLSEIFTSYFEKDAKNLADFRDMSKLRDLILLLVPRVASKVEVDKLAKELSISRETLYKYLSFLEKTYFISLLPKYSASIDRQTAGRKKLFFCDTGLANTLGVLSEGQMFEQSVFQSLRINHQLAYFELKKGSEIDFVVDGKTGLEVKTSGSNRDLFNLKRRANKLKLAEYYLVTYSESRETTSINCTNL